MGTRTQGDRQYFLCNKLNKDDKDYVNQISDVEICELLNIYMKKWAQTTKYYAKRILCTTSKTK